MHPLLSIAETSAYFSRHLSHLKVRFNAEEYLKTVVEPQCQGPLL